MIEHWVEFHWTKKHLWLFYLRERKNKSFFHSIIEFDPDKVKVDFHWLGIHQWKQPSKKRRNIATVILWIELTRSRFTEEILMNCYVGFERRMCKFRAYCCFKVVEKRHGRRFLVVVVVEFRKSFAVFRLGNCERIFREVLSVENLKTRTAWLARLIDRKTSKSFQLSVLLVDWRTNASASFIDWRTF